MNLNGQIKKAATIAGTVQNATGSGGSGKDGITPHIGDNGNWYLGTTDTGKPSRGENGKSAYQYAQDGGYTGTEAAFIAKLAEDSTGGGTAETWELIRNLTLTSDVAKVTINQDESGNAFSLKKAYVFITSVAPTVETINYEADIAVDLAATSPDPWSNRKVVLGLSPKYGENTMYAVSIWETVNGMFLPIWAKASFSSAVNTALTEKTTYAGVGAIGLLNGSLAHLQSPCTSMCFGSYRTTFSSGSNIKIYGVRS